VIPLSMAFGLGMLVQAARETQIPFGNDKQKGACQWTVAVVRPVSGLGAERFERHKAMSGIGILPLRLAQRAPTFAQDDGSLQ
jgi:hypothetical protein